MGNTVDTKDFNPVFARKMSTFFEAAKAAGLNPGYLESAYRPYGQQAEIYERSHHGRDFMAAPPGRSMHGFGMATDVISPDIMKLRAFANAHPEYGIYPLPGDTPHFQLAGDQRELMAHPPAGEPVALNWNLGPHKEGTWGGVTLNSVPASVHPPHTLTPSTAGAPYTPTAVADANPAPAPPAAPAAPQSWADRLFKRPEPTVDKDGKEVQGKSGIEKLTEGMGEAKPAAAPAAMESQPMLQAQDPMAGMAGPAAQMFAQMQAAAAKPLSWTSKPYGWDAGQQWGTTLNSTGYNNG